MSLEAAGLSLCCMSATSRDAASQRLLAYQALAWDGFLPPVVLHLRNKCDLFSETLRASTDENGECLPTVVVSARTGEGLEDLKAALKAALGAQAPEGSFSARSRHPRTAGNGRGVPRRGPFHA